MQPEEEKNITCPAASLEDESVPFHVFLFCCY